MTRVLIADDHRLLRQSLRRAMEDAGMTVVGEAANGREALDQVDALSPDVVVMDVSMPLLDGVRTTQRLHVRRPDLPVVILTMHDEEALKVEAIRSGAAAFLTKDCAMSEVVSTVGALAERDVDLSGEVATAILADTGSDEGLAPALTPREVEILQTIADGRSTSEVAAALFISAKTVKNHLAAIYRKLDARNRTEAVLTGVRAGIIRLR